MNSSQLIDVTDTPNVAANDYVTARNMAEALHRQFPGHAWAVTCEGRKGIATIRNLHLSGEWGYVLKLSRLNGDKHYRCVIRAGGELLERFRLNPGLAKQDRIDEMPMVAGRPIFDPSEAKSKVPELYTGGWDKLRGYATPIAQAVRDAWNKLQH